MDDGRCGENSDLIPGMPYSSKIGNCLLQKNRQRIGAHKNYKYITNIKTHMKGSWKAKRKQVHEMEPKNRPCSSNEKPSGGN
jgi:hypothetical protein